MRKAVRDRGETGIVFRNYIDRYMELWLINKLLGQNISQKGITIGYKIGNGEKGKKINDAVDLLFKSNKQMDKLLNKILGNPPENDDAGDEL